MVSGHWFIKYKLLLFTYSTINVSAACIHQLPCFLLLLVLSLPFLNDILEEEEDKRNYLY